MRWTAFAWIALAWGCPVFAQEIRVWPDLVDTIRVVASRPFPEERIMRPRGFVQVLPIDATLPPTRDLGDLLDGAAGAQVRRSGGLGAPSFVSVRGCSPSQVQVWIDDTPLSTAQDAMVNLSLLPIRLFERVEIERGPVGSRDAGNGAGVIRLVSPERFDLPLRLRTGMASFGTRHLSLSAALERGPVAVLVSGGALQSRGNYPYLDRGGTPYAQSDDAIVERANNHLEQQDLLVHTRIRLTRIVKVEASTHGFRKDAGIPGTESLQTKRVHDRFVRLMQTLTLNADGPNKGAWNLTLHQEVDRDRYRNLEGEVGLGRADTRSRLVARGIRLKGTWGVPGFGSGIGAGASFLRETRREEDLLWRGSAPTRVRETGTFSIDLARHSILRRLDLFAVNQWLVATEPAGRGRSLSTPRLGFVLTAGDHTSVRGGWGLFGRLPTFAERYGQNGVQTGNPGLAPETGFGWDLGVVIRGSGRAPGPLRVQAELVAFGSHTRDAIVWLQNSQRTMRPENIERATVRGIEGSLRLAYRPFRAPTLRNPAADWNASFTVQNPRDAGPSRIYQGNELPYLPGRQYSQDLGFTVGRLQLTHRLQFESYLYRDRYNSAEKRRGPRALQDIEGVLGLAKGRVEIGLGIQNVTNRRDQDVYGFPLPGRSISIDTTVSTPFGRSS